MKPFVGDYPLNPDKQSEEVDKSKYKIDNALLNELSIKALFFQEFRTDGNNTSPVVYNRYSNPLGQQNQIYNNSAY